MLFRNVFLYISCGLIPLILSDYFMEIPGNMLLFVAASFCSCCSGIFLGNEAVCSGRCGFSFSAECCISVIPLSMQR